MKARLLLLLPLLFACGKDPDPEATNKVFNAGDIDSVNYYFNRFTHTYQCSCDTIISSTTIIIDSVDVDEDNIPVLSFRLECHRDTLSPVGSSWGSAKLIVLNSSLALAGPLALGVRIHAGLA